MSDDAAADGVTAGDPRPDEGPWAPDDAGRRETVAERLDRNWNELLQELRVTQTGAQILTGFLLTVPFQQRFGRLDDLEVVTYLVLVALSTTATGLLVAPVSLHRFLFRRRLKRETVVLGHRLARFGLLALGLTIVGCVFFLFDVVVSPVVGAVAGGLALCWLVGLWVVLPWSVARRSAPGSLPTPV
ncbi:DUF6328 family protein [Luteimicrobium sp. DT211]|uniref:DUF6328 family protein n=1 Tax=Luteimicrobium sp. DT211 TaxID=3393412 RepID=UPI003CF5E745